MPSFAGETPGCVQHHYNIYIRLYHHVYIHILEIYAIRGGDTYSYFKNQLVALISQIYFGMKLCMFRTVPLSIIRSLAPCTQQWYMAYRFDSMIRTELQFRPDPVSKPV